MIWSATFNRLSREIPNALSYFRGLMGIVIAFLLLHPKPVWHGVAFFLFLVGTFTDFLDGFIARKFSLESPLGKILDPTTDKILVLIPLIIFTKLNLYSPLWVIPIVFREIVVTFCRVGWRLQGVAVGAEKIGKLKFGFQVAAVSAAFCYLLSRDYAGLHFMNQFSSFVSNLSVIAASILTIVSGISFIRTNAGHLNTAPFAKYVSAVGVGLIPVASGTWGSLAAFLVIPLVAWSPALYVSVFVFLMGAAWLSIRKLNLAPEEDPGYVVIDEFCGMLVTFFLIPLNPSSAFAGFFLFRLFDILKPFPLRRLEKIHGFWGIMLDDLGAGLYAWLILRFLF